MIHNLIPVLHAFELSILGSRYHLKSNQYTFSYIFVIYIGGGKLGAEL